MDSFFQQIKNLVSGVNSRATSPTAENTNDSAADLNKVFVPNSIFNEPFEVKKSPKPTKLRLKSPTAPCRVEQKKQL